MRTSFGISSWRCAELRVRPREHRGGRVLVQPVPAHELRQHHAPPQFLQHRGIGPRQTGYGLQRLLEAEGVICEMIAPSLTPVRPGAHIKTDRRDARKLAELLRAGLLTEVHPPSETDEALRDLCRCRDDVRVDLPRARHRLSKFLLRRHCIYRQTKHHWGSRHWAWLDQLRFDDAMSQATFASYRLAVQQLQERLCARYRRMTGRGTIQPKTIVAMARELTGYLWAVLHPDAAATHN